MYDTMKYIKSDVGTVAFGAAMGMSGFLLAVGSKVRRSDRIKPGLASGVSMQIYVIGVQVHT